MSFKARHDKFQGAAVICGDLRRESSIVIVFEHMESQARLFQIVNTLNPFSAGLYLCQGPAAAAPPESPMTAITVSSSISVKAPDLRWRVRRFMESAEL